MRIVKARSSNEHRLLSGSLFRGNLLCHKPLIANGTAGSFGAKLDLHSLHRFLIALRRKYLVLSRLRIEKPDVAARIHAKGPESFPVMTSAEKIIASRNFFATREVQWKHEIGNLHLVDLVGLGLYRITHFVPVEDIQPAVGRMLTGNEQIDFRISD